MKQTIHLKESELKKIITNSVKKYLNESSDTLADIKDLPKHAKYPHDNEEEDDDDYDDFEMGVLEENILKDIKNKLTSTKKNKKPESDKEYYREHTKFYKPRGWDKYTDKKGNFDFEKWWEKA